MLFWIYIQYDGPNRKNRIVPRFEKWNYVNTEELAALKKRTIADEEDFLSRLQRRTLHHITNH